MIYFINSRSSVNVDGYVSESFPLSRGVRQVCPLSPLLYVLVVKLLPCNIRVNPSIHGLCLPCVSLYADYTSLGARVCSDPWIRPVLPVFFVFVLFCFVFFFSHYERGSGDQLNRSKCMGLWLRSWNGRTDSPLDMKWTSEMVKVLGVFVSPGNVEPSELDASYHRGRECS